jgi:hypothetical protein
MIRHIPFQATHKGVYDILSLKQTTKTYDTVPNQGEFPCISFGPFTSKPGGAKNVDISDISLQLHIWSMDTSKKEIEEICNEVASVLTSWPLEIASLGFSVLDRMLISAKYSKKKRSVITRYSPLPQKFSI